MSSTVRIGRSGASPSTSRASSAPNPARAASRHADPVHDVTAHHGPRVDDSRRAGQVLRPLRIAGDEDVGTRCVAGPPARAGASRSTRRTPRSRAHASPSMTCAGSVRVPSRAGAPIRDDAGLVLAHRLSDGPVAHVSGIVVTAGLAGASRAHVTVAGRTLFVTPRANAQ